MFSTIENGQLTAVINHFGAELTSLKTKKDQMEYIWQADPAVWGRHAPLLFPIIGRLKDKKYTLGGKEYVIPQHGFARDSLFTLTRQDASSVSFTLTDSGETRQMYPYPFRLTIRYSLKGSSLVKEHFIDNLSDGTLYYEIGGHDAFRVALFPDEKMQDYYVYFEGRNSLNVINVDASVFLQQGTHPYALQDGKLYLTPGLFHNDALMFEDIAPRRVVLASDKNRHSVMLDFDSFPYLGIWSANKEFDTNYVCLEPWSTLPDASYLGYALEDKIGVRSVHANCQECMAYTVTID